MPARETVRLHPASPPRDAVPDDGGHALRINSTLAATVGPLLVGADELGRLLGLSSRAIRRLNAAGQVPKPLRLSGAVRWRLSEIVAWTEAGCPSRSDWEAMRAEGDS